MNRAYYSDTIINFLKSSAEEIVGKIIHNHGFDIDRTQREAWECEITILKETLNKYSGHIYFEFAIPRMGKRVDVILIIKNALFVLEFKIGEKKYELNALEQVWDYALDLKNFHETSHDILIAPVLIATKAKKASHNLQLSVHDDKVLQPLKSNSEQLNNTIIEVLKFSNEEIIIDASKWIKGIYSPTPTIIEAAKALYKNHSVDDITRNDSEKINLRRTSNTLSDIIYESQRKSFKSICFVTGVPGAGKTLVGLNVAIKHMDQEKKSTSVYLSGNGPLVAVLREALARDKVKREKKEGKRIRKSDALRKVKSIIQNIYNFKDEYAVEKKKAPFDHVAIFDEAQRAWDKKKTANFMRRRNAEINLEYSEPEFLVSCMDRHKDWAVIICLVGGGQEIHTGEAGISEWIKTINISYPDWHVFVSDKLTDSEYAAGKALNLLSNHKFVEKKEELHLAVSVRSFRAENLSLLVKNILDLKLGEAHKNYDILKHKYPIMLTRDLLKAKNWLKDKARGSERYGLIVSSQAERLKPHAIDVKSPVNPIHWFLNGKDDVRSSYYLEDVATEFHIQGLELDWACVTWDGDFRFSNEGWKHFSFKGKRWENINKDERKQYLKNAYRVLLTRARQGMVIVVPNGDEEDHTRKPEYYDSTFNYLNSIGFEVI